MPDSTGENFSRRRLLECAATSAAAPLVLRSAVLGKDGTVAPSERINLGFIGLGTLGPIHLRAFLSSAAVQVLAVCDVDRKRCETGKATVDTTYAEAQGRGKYSGCSAHNDFRELLARDDIDGVVITVGDRWNAVMAAMAAEAGKDMYCEKPVSLTIHEARAMANTVRRYNRIFQTGLQQRSEPQFRKAIELIQDGRLGALKMVYPNLPGTCGDVNLKPEPVPDGLDWELWLGQAPWRPYNSRFHPYGASKGVTPWAFCRDYSGGQLTNGSVHNFDIVQWGVGADGSGPVEIIPPGVNGAKSLTFKYANGVPVQVVDWKLDPKIHEIPEGWGDVDHKWSQKEGTDFCVVFVGEKGWIHVGRRGFLKAYPEEILSGWNYVRPQPAGDITTGHHRNWLQSIRSRQRPIAHEDIGAGSSIVSYLGNIAYWTGRALRWDPVKEEFEGDDEANRMRSRAMRAPWTI
jgi:predicted dehydrogenase